MRPLLIAPLVVLAGCANAFPVFTATQGDTPIVVLAQVDHADGTAALAFSANSLTGPPVDNELVAAGFLHASSGPAIGASLVIDLQPDCDFAAATTLTPALPPLDRTQPCGSTVVVSYEEGGAGDAVAFPSGGSAASITGTVALDPQSNVNAFTLSVSGHLDVTITDGAGQRRHVVAGFDTRGMPPAP